MLILNIWSFPLLPCSLLLPKLLQQMQALLLQVLLPLLRLIALLLPLHLLLQQCWQQLLQVVLRLHRLPGLLLLSRHSTALQVQ